MPRCEGTFSFFCRSTKTLPHPPSFFWCLAHVYGKQSSSLHRFHNPPHLLEVLLFIIRHPVDVPQAVSRYLHFPCDSLSAHPASPSPQGTSPAGTGEGAPRTGYAWATTAATESAAARASGSAWATTAATESAAARASGCAWATTAATESAAARASGSA